MCGIVVLLGKQLVADQLRLKEYFDELGHRGPDNHSWVQINDEVVFGFHRRKIQGLDDESNEPLFLDKVVLVCNGEIYNHRELKEAHPHWDIKTNNDCEVILHLYREYGIFKAAKKLDGEFAFVLYDMENGIVMSARDHLGVRPLYSGSYKHGLVLSSELRSIRFAFETSQTLPRHILFASPKERDVAKLSFSKLYFQFPFGFLRQKREEILNNVRTLFIDAVRKRIHNTDVPFGFTLSGGLDSTLVLTVAIHVMREENKDFDPSTFHTYSIGTPGSPDLLHAQEVADFFGTTHHSYLVSFEDLWSSIPVACRHTYDTTSVRAMSPHHLLCKKIAEEGNVIVLLSGEVADEASGSYAYFEKAPHSIAFQREAMRILLDIHHFDGLRADRVCSSFGLELRVPFSDKAFLSYYLRIPSELKMFGGDTGTVTEKAILRDAFQDLLPPSIYSRRKNGFSDSVSSSSDSWVDYIKERITKEVSDLEYRVKGPRMKPDPPTTKEDYYYRKLFQDALFSEHPRVPPRPIKPDEKDDDDDVKDDKDRMWKEKMIDNWRSRHDTNIPYKWMPKWTDATDPSARALDHYQAD